MKNNNQFPNGLRIVRRKVTQDESIKFIDSLLKRIDSYKNQQSKFLKQYLENSKKIDV